MNSNFELISELAHYSNDVNEKISDLSSFTNETLEKHQHLAAEFGEFSKSLLEKLTENEAVGLTEFVRRVLNLYQESDAGFNMQVEMIKWNNEKAGVYIDNYGKAAKM